VADVSAHGNARHDDERIERVGISFSDYGGLQWRLKKMPNRLMSVKEVSLGLLLVLGLMLPTKASAHNGPPFPIIEGHKIGSCVFALWTHPDVGTGAFYVFVEPAPGGTIPGDLKIQIGVQPLTGRLSETFYQAQRVKSRGPVQYNAQAAFDRQEVWRVRLVVQSAQGGGEGIAQVLVTPPGFGKWDLLFFLLPFLIVAFLWFRGISRVKRRRNMQLGEQNRAANSEQMAGNAERGNQRATR
jgi:hypothetical protein